MELQLEDGKEEIQRLRLIKEVPENLAPGLKDRLEANAFTVLACLLNLVGENVSYYATFERAGRAVSKTGTLIPWQRLIEQVRLFKTLVTDIQSVYGDAKDDFIRSLDRFNESLQDVGLLSVLKILNRQEGFPCSLIVL